MSTPKPIATTRPRFTTRSIAIIAVLAALTVGSVVPAALAQDGADDTATEDTTTEDTTTESTEDATPADRLAEQRAALAAALAEELGLDTQTVAEALETVQAEMAEARASERAAQLEEELAAAVQDGSLTQEQADALIAAHEAGVLGGRGVGLGAGGHRGHGDAGAFGAPDANDADA